MWMGVCGLNLKMYLQTWLGFFQFPQTHFAKSASNQVKFVGYPPHPKCTNQRTPCLSSMDKLISGSFLQSCLNKSEKVQRTVSLTAGIFTLVWCGWDGRFSAFIYELWNCKIQIYNLDLNFCPHLFFVRWQRQLKASQVQIHKCAANTTQTNRQQTDPILWYSDWPIYSLPVYSIRYFCLFRLWRPCGPKHCE